MQVEQRLRFDDRYLIRERMERMDMQFIPTCFKIDVAERLQPADGQVRKRDKEAAIFRESFQIIMALTVQIGAHLFDLKISHITQAATERTFVSALAAKLKSLDQAAFGKKLARRTDQLRQANIALGQTDHMGTARGPNRRIIAFGLNMPPSINSE